MITLFLMIIWCILDFYNYWLETEYPKKLSKADLEKYDTAMYSNKFDSYVSKVIGYLKRPQEQGTKSI